MDQLELPVWEVAPRLLGWRLCRRLHDRLWKLTIVETEAYAGGEDQASHAWRGITPRNRPMFGAAGRAYVYFIYGMHHCFNVVAHVPGEAGAILIRALDYPGCNGPARLCRFLQIDKDFSDIDLFNHPQLWLEPGSPPGDISVGPRIGISRSKELLWRFWVTKNKR